MPFPLLALLPSLIGAGGSIASALLGKRAGKPSNDQSQANNLLNYNAQTATQARDTGMGYLNLFSQNLDAPTGYFQKLLSGDKTLMSQAVAPTAGAISSQFDAAKRSVNQNMPRGGYSSTLQAELPFQKAQQVGNLFSTLQPAAAQGLMNIAGLQGQLGANLINTGFNAGNYASGLFGQFAGQQQNQANQAGQGISGLLGTLLPHIVKLLQPNSTSSGFNLNLNEGAPAGTPVGYGNDPWAPWKTP
jgi:phage-related minor tail protein